MMRRIAIKILAVTFFSLPYFGTLQAETEIVTPLSITGPQIAVCAGQSVEMKASGGQKFEFFWTPDNLVDFPTRDVVHAKVRQTTTFKVVRINRISLKRDSAYFTIRVDEKRTEIDGNNYICAGDSTFIKIDTRYSNPVWSTGERSYGIWVKTPGIYSVVANEGCNSIKGELFVSSKTKPVSRIMPSRSTDLCLGEKVTLKSFSPDQPQWSTGESSKSIVVASTQKVVLNNSNECGVSTDEIDVTIRHVNAYFTTDHYKGSAPLKIQFYNGSEKASHFFWYLNDELFSEEENPSLMLSEIGSYEVRLRVYNPWGCRSEMTYNHFQVVEPSAPLVAKPSDEVIYPNSFTPNGDGLNDEFTIQSNGSTHLAIRVFDRWGQLVYEEEGYHPIWKGTDRNGRDLPNGQYLIQVNYQEPGGERISETNPIHLIR